MEVSGGCYALQCLSPLLGALFACEGWVCGCGWAHSRWTDFGKAFLGLRWGLCGLCDVDSADNTSHLLMGQEGSLSRPGVGWGGAGGGTAKDCSAARHVVCGVGKLLFPEWESLYKVTFALGLGEKVCKAASATDRKASHCLLQPGSQQGL